ncbi:MAG: CAAX prenyl protease-related protein [Verrucomicrobiota bacterium]|nr:CAAX prenyl protease-related protein [Chthoniobacterales bacterium]MDQ3626252.1 CAAX prenyl protease-related protein [Verrucomicrobiota bacterium]
MDSALAAAVDRRKLLAYTVPLAVFLGFLALRAGLKKIGGSFWLEAPEYWVYPLQTFVCGALLFWYRREYEFRGIARLLFTLAVGITVFALWVSPQAFFGFAARTDGFNPDTFAGQPAAYWLTVLLRFLRLVIVVPLVEEIFWRGFLLRYFINEKFTAVPFGSFSWLSFGAVTIGFTLMHSSADWPAAAVTGMLYNVVAYQTKSLGSCVLAHAVTNLLLGIWIMQTGQWGFW